MGGSGKTLLASTLAHDLWDAGELDLLIWVSATSRDAVKSTLAHAAVELALGGHGLTSEQAAAQLLAWLHASENRWLVVYDDLADPADIQGLWPTGRQGRVLVTTRRRDATLSAGDRELIDVSLFTVEQAVSYLQHKLADQPGASVGARELATELRLLPLALAQAASFVLDRPSETCAHYRKRISSARRTLAELLPPDALADDYRSTVAATWSISIESANQIGPIGLAEPALQVAGVLDPNGALEAVFHTDAVLRHLSRARGRMEPARNTHGSSVKVSADDDDASDVVSLLHRFSLVSLDNTVDGTLVRTHPLVQRAVVEGMQSADLTNVVRAAADGLCELWPDTERVERTVRVLRANAEALLRSHLRALLLPTFHPILTRFGTSLGRTGSVDSAAAYWREVAEVSTETHGNEATCTLDCLHQAGYWRGESGDLSGAVSAFAELLPVRERVSGAASRETLAVRHQLARWQGERGDAVGARRAFERLLSDQVRTLGGDDVDTLATRHNLAYWRGVTGDLAGAVFGFETLLIDRDRVLGPDHVDTLATRHNLARWRGEAGQISQALAILRDLLAELHRVLGPDHPDALATRGLLARWQGESGDFEGAADMVDRLLTDRVRILGSGHPHTMIARHNLAYWRMQAGDVDRATAALEDFVIDRASVLGTDDPAVAAVSRQLTNARGHKRVALEGALAAALTFINPDNPKAASTQYNLVHRRDKQQKNP